MNAPLASASATQDTSPALLRSVDLTGPAGRLEAVLNEGTANAPFAALLCHPHPKGGGNLHNKVVYRAMKAINDPAWGLGAPVLRFNFRGTGLSAGTHDGQLESEDVLASLAWLESRYQLPLVVAGFSFGAVMALKAICSAAGARFRVPALVALGLPTHAEGRHYSYTFLSHPKTPNCSMPKLFLSGDRDQYAPAEELRQVAASTAQPSQLVLIPNADHFFSNQLEAMQTALSGWLRNQFSNQLSHPLPTHSLKDLSL